MRQIEIPIHDNTTATSRSTDIAHTTNQHLNVSSAESLYIEIKNALNELYIRFDTTPEFYLKEDYKKLLDVLNTAFKTLYNKVTPEVVTSWGNPTSDEKIPSEKLVKLSLDLEITDRQTSILNLMPLIYAGL